MAFLETPIYKCVLANKCPNRFISNPYFSEQFANGFSCEKVKMQQYFHNTDEYSFFLAFMKAVSLIRNDMVLKEVEGKYVANVVVSKTTIAKITFTYKDGYFELYEIEGACAVFESIECALS